MARLAYLALTAIVSASALPACDSRTPSEIAGQRQQQQQRPTAPAEPAFQPAPTPIEDPTDVVSGLSNPARGRRLDIAAARGAGTVQIDANDPFYPPRLDAVFDGKTDTLSRSESVNPLLLTFRFAKAIRLEAVRLFPSYSWYDWSIVAAAGQKSLTVRSAPPDRWSAIVLPASIETQQVVVRIRRLERDDIVHVNEVEFWTSPLTPTP